MAARKTPSAGGKPDKLFRDALMIAVNRPHADNPDKIKDFKKINALATKLVDRAIEGNEQAAQIVRDSIDGKPAQSIGLGQAEDLEPLKTEAIERPRMTREQWLAEHGK